MHHARTISFLRTPRPHACCFNSAMTSLSAQAIIIQASPFLLTRGKRKRRERESGRFIPKAIVFVSRALRNGIKTTKIFLFRSAPKVGACQRTTRIDRARAKPLEREEQPSKIPNKRSKNQCAFFTGHCLHVFTRLATLLGPIFAPRWHLLGFEREQSFARCQESCSAI